MKAESGYYTALQRYAPNLKSLNIYTPKSINNIIMYSKLGIILDFHAPKHFEDKNHTPKGASRAPR